MRLRARYMLRASSLSERFMLASLVVMVVGTIGVGWWIAGQIESEVIHQAAATTALYVDSFIRPHIEELSETSDLSPTSTSALGRLLKDTPLGQQIVAFKIWDSAGRVLYSTDPTTVGQTYPMHEPLARAWRGQVAAKISDLEEAENAPQKRIRPRLLEIYSPVRLGNSDRIVAVAEFYQTVDNLQRDIRASQQRGWLLVGTIMLVTYLLLAAFVWKTSEATEELHERIRRAAARATTSNERFLRRVSAEMHDGPIQDLGFALLRIDHVMAHAEVSDLAGDCAEPDRAPSQGCDCQDSDQCHGDLVDIKASLQRALREIRGISRGLGLPQLAELTVAETVRRAVRDHERRTSTSVELNLAALPDQAPTSVKITLYRLLQEALNNAYRHAGGVGQGVRVFKEAGLLRVEVSDQGPGFDTRLVENWDQHLGLAGMRERVESLGGRFQIVSVPAGGIRVIARLPIAQREG